MGTSSQRSGKTNNHKNLNNDRRNVPNNNKFERKTEISKPKNIQQIQVVPESVESGISSRVSVVLASLVLGIMIGMLLQAYLIPMFSKNGPEIDVSLSSVPQGMPVEVQFDSVQSKDVDSDATNSKSQLQEEKVTKDVDKPQPGNSLKEPSQDVVNLEVKPEDMPVKTPKTEEMSEQIREEVTPPEMTDSPPAKREQSEVKKKETVTKEEKPMKDDNPVKDSTELKFEGQENSKNPKSKTKSSVNKDTDNDKAKTQVKSEEKSFDIEKAVREFKSSILNQFTPKKIFQDGRRIPPIELHHTKENNSTVRAYLFEEFFSKAECDGLMKAHDSHVTNTNKQDPLVCFDSIKTLRSHLKEMKKTKVKVSPKVFTKGTTCLNATFSTQFKEWSKANWSFSTAFYPGESRFTSLFDQRVERSTGFRTENGGKFQITSYPVGIGYKTHTDCREGADKRDRFATILVYLQDVEEGGETKFPELGIWVKPRKGRALIWTNMNEKGECDPQSVHYAAKVVKGHKYILQRWYYYENFYSLGKRPPEPHLPPHNPGQPMVSCDEYENGSCRWYDEWNYDHILDYRNQKVNLI
ncbi:uncharacterized protein LOC135500354 [Lineus longissimus]|uniref:uncharacterized protein LOC135500354 n=1 Tax=Lineus longissimus TaxID=88925 RepID=UPI002B4C8D5F